MLTLKAVYFFSISNQMGCWLSHLILISVNKYWMIIKNVRVCLKIVKMAIQDISVSKVFEM